MCEIVIEKKNKGKMVEKLIKIWMKTVKNINENEILRNG